MSNFQDPEILRAVLDSLPTGVCVVDRSGKILLWNQGAERIAGHRQHDVIGHDHDWFLAHDKGKGCNTTCPFHNALHQGKSAEAGLVVQHKQGHSVPVLMRFVAIRDMRGSIVAVAASFDTHNSSSRRERDRRTGAPAGCADEVTGLANQDFTQFHLRENLIAFTEYQIPFGIICIRVERLDHFRSAYGHEAGDCILQVVAQNLSNSFRPNDFVGRWGDDEFIAILSKCPRSSIEKAFERVHKLINRASIRWWGEQLSLAISMGYAAVEAGDTVASLTKRAERSLRETHTSDGVTAGADSPTTAGS
jgi:diguanylate cyclase (GGDEF)-like protein/PAS domain S-box-containing protein